MITITSTNLRLDTAAAYNKVMTEGRVRIQHRDRPPMVLISEAELDKLENEAKQIEKV